MKNKHYNKSGLTLIELVVAIILLSFVFLAIGGIDISSRRLLGTVDRETMTLMDASPAMQHMEKWIALATGDLNHMGITVDTADHKWIEFRADYDDTGVCKNTPEDYNDDILRKYELIDNDLVSTVGANTEILARKVNDIYFDLVQGGPTNDFYVKVELEALYDPTEAQGLNNPIVKLQTNISPRCHSIN